MGPPCGLAAMPAFTVACFALCAFRRLGRTGSRAQVQLNGDASTHGSKLIMRLIGYVCSVRNHVPRCAHLQLGGDACAQLRVRLRPVAHPDAADLLQGETWGGSWEGYREGQEGVTALVMRNEDENRTCGTLGAEELHQADTCYVQQGTVTGAPTRFPTAHTVSHV